MSEKKLLTYEGLKKLEDELQNLKVYKRKEIAEKIKEAREQGDLSENAEYDAAKDEQRDIERVDFDRLHAGICAEPFQIQRKRTDPQYVPVCLAPSRHRHAGICIPDHVQSGMDQLPAGIYHHDVRDGYHFHLHFYTVF